MMLKLEDFDANHRSPHGATHDIASDSPGYAEGYAAGSAEARAAQQNVDMALVQTLEDMAFGFAEARAALLDGLVPLFRALTDQLLPQIVDAAFHARLAENLTDLAKGQLGSPVRLIVHPDQVAAVSQLLPRVTGLQIDLHQDAAVGAHGALISQQQAERILDLDELVAEIRTTLAAIPQTPLMQKELPDHG